MFVEFVEEMVQNVWDVIINHLDHIWINVEFVEEMVLNVLILVLEQIVGLVHQDQIVVGVLVIINVILRAVKIVRVK